MKNIFKNLALLCLILWFPVKSVAQNTPPEVTRIELLPKNATIDDDLTCDYDYYDADGDPEDTSQRFVAWQRNGVWQTEFRDQLTVPASATEDNEKWEVFLRVHDGTEESVETYTASVEFGTPIPNTQPEAQDVEILPSNPTTNDDLNLSYTYYDADGDPEDESQRFIAWRRNGEWTHVHRELLTVPAADTRKGEVWESELRVHDGKDESAEYWAPPVTIGNTPPVATDLSLIPTNPSESDALTASYTYSDVDDDPESGTEIRWYEDTILQPDYNDQLSVPASATSGGEEWYFTVGPSDGEDFGDLQTCSTVVIGNTPPEATDLAITPIDPETEDDLTASYIYSDGDGDLESGTEIRWYNDSVLQPDYNDQLSIPASATSGGEEWYFTVHPSDGVDFGDLQTSPTVTVAETRLQANFDAKPTIGIPQLSVQFQNLTEGNAHTYEWSFGDGEYSTAENPIHDYSEPGTYSVSLSATGPGGSNYIHRDNFITVYEDSAGYVNLNFVDGSEDIIDEPWKNSIDADTWGWDGTTTAKGDPAWSIFEFNNQETIKIDHFRLLTNTGVNLPSRWVKEFRVQVSTSGTLQSDFNTVLDTVKENGEWETFYITPINAKYVKLIIDEPTGWCEVGEFEVWEHIPGPCILNITVTPTEAGSVIKYPDSSEYDHNQDVILTAVPSSSIYVFDHWSGDLSGTNNPDTLTMKGEHNVTAHFRLSDEEVSIPDTVNGPSTGFTNQSLNFSTDGSTSNLGHDVEYQFDWGGSSLSDWGNAIRSHTYSDSGTYYVKSRARCKIHTNVISGWSVTHTVTISSCSLKILINPSNAGSVIKNPDKYGYEFGDAVTITAIPDTGWKFAGWSGDHGGNNNPAIISIRNHMSITANFEQKTYTLMTYVTPSGTGNIIKSPNKAKYTYGEVVVCTAIANPDSSYKFNHWSGDISDTVKSVSLIMARDKTITAHFSSSVTNVSDLEVYGIIPSEFALMQNYPNPFNSETIIRYQLPKSSYVKLEIFNTLGERIRTLVDVEQNAGFYQVIWDGKNDAGLVTASGIYFYVLKYDKGITYKKAIFLK